jgi:FtsP/CotA-like multicopper oxidase with cupredoxin domain
MNRRNFFQGATLGAVAASSVSRVALAAVPEPVSMTHANTAPPLVPSTGRPYNPVVTSTVGPAPGACATGSRSFTWLPNPWCVRLHPASKPHLWGYNGQSPGPTIEVVEGDRVRIFLTNKLPEHTTMHWHGQRLPNGMDGVSGLTQPQIPTRQNLCV